ncbi:MAG: hypothetical protein AMJ81_12055 [Phycisphaerae bacterium SM23_33]|nr:MAG: hypothetical protein AMJ81_12055 [Phycisphaerae bacterium SM23_33]
MPRGSGSFRVRPHRDAQGRLIYRNNSVALGLYQLLLSLGIAGPAGLVLWDTGPAWEGPITLLLWALLLCGLAMAAWAITCLLQWQRMVLDPAGGKASFCQRSVRGRQEVECDYDDVRLRVHRVEFKSARGFWPAWRGHAVAFHPKDTRFVAAQVHDRRNAEEIAAQTELDTAIPWEFSPEAITVGEWAVL